MNKFISKIFSKNIAIILLIAIFFISDRYLKILALSLPTGYARPLLGDVLSFGFAPNYYMAFSLPLGGILLNGIIIVIIFILLSFIFYLILNKKGENTSALLLTFILFGAISNILDRLIHGYVIDYIEIRGLTIFNMADAMITLGVVFFLLNSLVLTKTQKNSD